MQTKTDRNISAHTLFSPCGCAHNLPAFSQSPRSKVSLGLWKMRLYIARGLILGTKKNVPRRAIAPKLICNDG